MEPSPGWVKQWHQQMPGLGKEGERGAEGSDLRTTQEMKELELLLSPPASAGAYIKFRHCSNPPAWSSCK